MSAGTARRKFANITLKLISKLYGDNEKIEESVDETPFNASNQKVKDTKEKDAKDSLKEIDGKAQKPKQRRPSQNSRSSITSERLILPPIRRSSQHMKFASLVRLARYRKMMTRSRASSVTSDVSEEPEAIEDKPELPRSPRFCATLSPEAQYAMLKGYEDILLDTLKDGTKKEPKDCLYRVKRPHHKVVSVHVNNLERRQAELLRELQKPSSKRRLPVKKTERDPFFPENDEDEIETPKGIPKDKQIWLTHRFQCAMDILDKLREEKGQLVTSPRYKHRTIHPVSHYNSWSQDWSREFKLEYMNK